MHVIRMQMREIWLVLASDRKMVTCGDWHASTLIGGKRQLDCGVVAGVTSMPILAPSATKYWFDNSKMRSSQRGHIEPLGAEMA